ncbi:MAG: UDP-glucose/GDP-mannose dehydrogenase family protein [Elusimicrobiota bacterium]|jgi:UDPglucose 6-dehydrogenase|nr:UDP-glucose/GDP-mannose dehydrogenase family protein [Elusimicrobiota bacterium]
MNITMIGSGYVGLVSGACLADSGNNVICADVDKEKIAMLNSGKVPIFEPGLDEVIARNIKEKRISFSMDIDYAVKNSDVIFIAVGTPMSQTGEADLTYVFNAAKMIAKSMNGYKLIVDKSTVPVGTAQKVKEIISKNTKHEFDVASNPEFLKEGSAIEDFAKPDRVVIGVDSKKASQILHDIYEPFLRTFHPLIVMDVRSAEMTTYAANCFLATKISFINEISNLCEKAQADINLVREGIGADKRIGYEFLFPGVGYGGSCFPKDVLALIHTGKSFGYKTKLLEAVDEVNEEQKSVLVNKVLEHFQKENIEGALDGFTFCVWGLSFKPRTDDMRQAPSLVIIDRLIKLGACVQAFDPVAEESAKSILGNYNGKLVYASSQYEACKNADALLLITEWSEFRKISFETLRQTMKGKVIFDGRNIYRPKNVRQEGFVYYGMGTL